MKRFTRLVTGAGVGALTLLAGPVATAHAATSAHTARAGAVFAQTNDPAGNHVLAYAQAANGTLSAAGHYATGGKGAAESGAAVDPLASQGSLAYDAAEHLLLVTNAGSDSVSVFSVHGTHLTWRQALSSGGQFPTSVTIEGDLAYVLDAGGHGAVQGYRITNGTLHRISRSNRSLGLANTTPPNFLMAPGQVGFTPDGAHLIVTTKANGTIDVFGVHSGGRLSHSAWVDTLTGQVPFAFSFDGAGRLIVVDAANSAVSAYKVAASGKLTVVSGPVADSQKAACWIASAAHHNFYVANAGSATISGYHVASNGTVSLLASQTTTAGGPIDLVASRDGKFVYSENGGAGTIDEFAVRANGSLSAIGQITGLSAGVVEGITAI